MGAFRARPECRATLAICPVQRELYFRAPVILRQRLIFSIRRWRSGPTAGGEAGRASWGSSDEGAAMFGPPPTGLKRRAMVWMLPRPHHLRPPAPQARSPARSGWPLQAHLRHCCSKPARPKPAARAPTSSDTLPKSVRAPSGRLEPESKRNVRTTSIVWLSATAQRWAATEPAVRLNRFPEV